MKAKVARPFVFSGLTAVLCCALVACGSGNDPGPESVPAPGLQIAYVREHLSPGEGSDVYVANADGSGGERRLTEGPGRKDSPAWSPDGKRIAFSSDSDGTYEIFALNVDSTGQKALTDSPVPENPFPDSPFSYIFPEDLNNYAPVWSPNGGQVAFLCQLGTGFTEEAGYADGFERRDVCVANADGSGQFNLTDAPDDDEDDQNDEDEPAWSPDGKRVAFQWEGWKEIGSLQIRAVDTTEGGITRLVDSPERLKEPAYSPDGERIASSCAVEYEGPGICVANADGSGGFARLTQARTDDGDGNPAWSPDGEKIAFESSSYPFLGRGTGDTQTAVCVMNRDGSGKECSSWSEDAKESPSWSPDGEWLSFHRNGDEDAPGGIYVVPADDPSEPRPLLTRTDESMYMSPVWRPAVAREGSQRARSPVRPAP